MLQSRPAIPEPGPAPARNLLFFFEKNFRGRAKKFLCLLWIVGAIQISLAAAPGGRDFGRTIPDVRSIDEDEAAEVLAAFRASRGGLDSIMEASLTYYPRSGRKKNREAVIRSGWEGSVLSLRIDWKEKQGADVSSRRFLFRGGAEPEGWTWDSDKETVRQVNQNDFLRPIVPGMDLTAFDLTAPYLDWTDFSYEGSERVSGSPAHWFRFAPPPEWKPALSEAGIGVVRVALDTRFDAPIRVEYLRPGNEVRRTLDARSFKKISNTWIVRRMEAFDEKSRDRTELTVENAVVEISLPESIFLPSGLSSPD